MVTVKTKSVYDPVEPEDGARILVMRFYPRGLSKDRLQVKVWLKDLAPSRLLLKSYRAGSITWGDFVRNYCGEMAANEQARFLISGIASGGFGETVTLLCWERGAEKCHRFILKQMIEEAARK